MGRKLPPGSRIVLASHNKGKLTELTDLLRPFQIEVVSADALGLPEPDETAPDFAGNARIKARAATTAARSAAPGKADWVKNRFVPAQRLIVPVVRSQRPRHPLSENADGSALGH